ncbi:MAG: hypothetical protein JWN40_6035 [Phycisphaerales bacterium]|nr:hypothetical protein [Phycisphaerales bacterium]
MLYRRSPILIEPLEPRRLLAAAYPSDLEQYELELINRARANPAAEAARYGIDLNEGLAPGTISTAAKQPLAINPFLTDGARTHSQWMLSTDTFSHTGAGGASPDQRMSAAGYAFAAPSAWSENIAWRSFITPSITPDLAARLQRDLFVDTGIDGRGHRTSMTNNAFREIGVGMLSGSFHLFTKAAMLTTDFASTAGSAFLTGVVYADTVTANSFYTPGEGFGGVTLTARRTSDNALFSTTSFPSGGYSLQLAPGNYSVTASGGALAQSINISSITIGTENVKQDYIPGTTPPPPPPPPTPADTAPPTAKLTQALRARTAQRYYSFMVTYADDTALDGATFDNYDIVVAGPRGYLRYALFNAGDTSSGTPRVVNYIVKGPGGAWDASDDGLYTITLRRRQVADASGNVASAATLGAFSVIIPSTTSPAAAPAIVVTSVKRSLFPSDLAEAPRVFA